MLISDWSSDGFSSDLYTADNAEEDLNQAKFITKPVQLPQVVLDMVSARIKRLKKVRLTLPPRPDDADWPQDLLFFDLEDGGPRKLKRSEERRVGNEGVSQSRSRW